MRTPLCNLYLVESLFGFPLSVLVSPFPHLLSKSSSLGDLIIRFDAVFHCSFDRTEAHCFLTPSSHVVSCWTIFDAAIVPEDGLRNVQRRSGIEL